MTELRPVTLWFDEKNKSINKSVTSWKIILAFLRCTKKNSRQIRMSSAKLTNWDSSGSITGLFKAKTVE